MEQLVELYKKESSAVFNNIDSSLLQICSDNNKCLR